MTDIIKLDASAINEIEWVATRDGLIEQSSEVVSIDSDDDLCESGKLQTKISKHLKELETIRTKVKRPALEFGKAVDEQAKTLRYKLEKELDRIKQLNGDYATRKAKEAEAERQRIAAEEARKAAEQAPITFGGLVLETAPESAEPMAPLPTGKVSTGANSMVTVWEFDVVDARMVPDQFKTVDARKLREFMNYKTKMGETPAVPGVVFRSRVDVRAR